MLWNRIVKHFLSDPSEFALAVQLFIKTVVKTCQENNVTCFFGLPALPVRQIKIKQDGRLPPAYFLPLNFVEDAFEKDESFFSVNAVSSSKFCNFPKMKFFRLFRKTHNEMQKTLS